MKFAARQRSIAIALGAVIVPATIAAGLVLATSGRTPPPRHLSVAAGLARAKADTSTPPQPCILEVSPTDTQGHCTASPPPAVPEGTQSQPNAGVGNQADLPDCIPVDAGKNTVGCALKADVFGSEDHQREVLAATPAGFPVYATSGSSTVIGYLSDAGFIPNALATQVDAVRACNAQFAAEVKGQGGQLSPSCVSLLEQQGTDPAVLAGK
jgi:hypothetical protein